MMFLRRSSLVSLAILLLAAALTAVPSGAQEEQKKSDDAAARGAGTPDADAAEQADEEAEEPIAGAAVADSLRQPGEVVSQTGDLHIEVDSQYYAEFPGYDLDQLTPGQHEWLLKQANHVYCTCGCKGDTVARCVVLDPTCQTARQMLDKILAKASGMSEEDLAAAAAQAAQQATPTD